MSRPGERVVKDHSTETACVKLGTAAMWPCAADTPITAALTKSLTPAHLKLPVELKKLHDAKPARDPSDLLIEAHVNVNNAMGNEKDSSGEKVDDSLSGTTATSLLFVGNKMCVVLASLSTSSPLSLPLSRRCLAAHNSMKVPPFSNRAANIGTAPTPVTRAQSLAGSPRRLPQRAALGGRQQPRPGRTTAARLASFLATPPLR